MVRIGTAFGRSMVDSAGLVTRQITKSRWNKVWLLPESLWNITVPYL